MISDPKLPLTEGVASVEPIEPASEATAAPVPALVPRPTRSRARLWLRRIGFLLFVFLCATLGVMLVILPWRSEWSDNPLLLSYPTLRAVVTSGFARGVSTGLGVLNVWIGFWEAIQYQED
jgi:hypothetical protein